MHMAFVRPDRGRRPRRRPSSDEIGPVHGDEFFFLAQRS